MNLKSSNENIDLNYRKILATLPRAKRRQLEKKFLKRAKQLRKEKHESRTASKP